MMNTEQDELIRNLREKINQIISLYEKTKDEKQSLLHEKLELMEKVELLSRKNEELMHQYDTLKLAKTIAAGSDDSHHAKIKINRIVREIDKCIALLNR
ncbi:MAG: hypothetical protein ACEPOZ_16610 [Marinifilaceae bacterium]|jgi:uncharacterized protein (DUF3084 family)